MTTYDMVWSLDSVSQCRRSSVQSGADWPVAVNRNGGFGLTPNVPAEMDLIQSLDWGSPAVLKLRATSSRF